MAHEPLAHPDLEIVRPYLNQRSRYHPKIGDLLTVDLPGEKVRAEIKGVATDDIVLAQLLSTPISRGAIGFNKGDLLDVGRIIGDHGLEIWRALSEHDLRQQEARSKLDAEQQRLDDAAAHERVAAIRERNFAAKAAAEARAAQAEAERLPPPDGSNWSA